MKVHVLSDIHLEFGKWQKDIDVNAINADVTILAGDIGVGLSGLDFALKFKRPVIYVMGNHEYYGQRTMAKLMAKARAKVANTNVHLLEDDTVTLDGVRFIGCTLWTDFLVLGKEQRDSLMRHAQERMNDFHAIRIAQRHAMTDDSVLLGQTWQRGRVWTPQQAADRNAQSVQFLTQALVQRSPSDWSKTIVVTHHAPTVLSLAYKKATDPLDGAYASHLDELVAQADLWVHGHTHIPVDYQIGTGRVVSNPRGYLQEGLLDGFIADLVIEV